MNITASYWLSGSVLQKKKHTKLDCAPKRNGGKKSMLSKQDDKLRTKEKTCSWFPENMIFYKHWNVKQNKNHNRIILPYPFKCRRGCYNLDYDLKYSCWSRLSFTFCVCSPQSFVGRVSCYKCRERTESLGVEYIFLFLCIFSSQKRKPLIHHVDRSPQASIYSIQNRIQWVQILIYVISMLRHNIFLLLSEHYYLLLVHNWDPIVMNCDIPTYFMCAGHIKFTAITLERNSVIYWNLIVGKGTPAGGSHWIFYDPVLRSSIPRAWMIASQPKTHALHNRKF